MLIETILKISLINDLIFKETVITIFYVTCKARERKLMCGKFTVQHRQHFGMIFQAKNMNLSRRRSCMSSTFGVFINTFKWSILAEKLRTKTNENKQGSSRTVPQLSRARSFNSIVYHFIRSINQILYYFSKLVSMVTSLRKTLYRIQPEYYTFDNVILSLQ